MAENRDRAEAVVASEMMDWIREIVALGIRRPGWPEQRLTERYMQRRFAEFGLEDIVQEPVPVHAWQPETTRLQLVDDSESLACSPIPYTAWTDTAGVNTPLAWIGDGQPAELDAVDLRGKIVVMNARFKDFVTGPLKQAAMAVHDPEATIPDGVLHKANWLIANWPIYYEAQKRGAVGFVGLLVDSPIDESGHWVPYDGWIKDLPAVWMAKNDADRVRRAAERGESAQLVSTGTTDDVDSHNVVGWVRGSGEEIVLLTSHHDAPWASAVEDASGLSLLLGLAKRFRQRQRKLNRTLLFVAASGHFHGGIGNRIFVEKHRDDWLRQTVAALGMEHIAQEVESDGVEYRLTGRPEVRAIFTENCPALVQAIARGVAKHNLDRTLVLPPYLFGTEPPCDAAPYFTAGIASASLISGPLYLFDRYDTVDKVRQEDLPRALDFFTDLIEEIDAMPTEELRSGLAHAPGDPAPPMPDWFAPPERYLGTE